MADTRRPVKILLLRNQGNEKSEKIEIFKSTDWKDWLNHYSIFKHSFYKCYRIRINGVWFVGRNNEKYIGEEGLKTLLFNKIFDGFNIK